MTRRPPQPGTRPGSPSSDAPQHVGSLLNAPSPFRPSAGPSVGLYRPGPSGYCRACPQVPPQARAPAFPASVPRGVDVQDSPPHPLRPREAPQVSGAMTGVKGLPPSAPCGPWLGGGLIPLRRPGFCPGSLSLSLLPPPCPFKSGWHWLHGAPIPSVPLESHAFMPLCPSLINRPFIKIPAIIFQSVPSVPCWDPD